LRESTSEAITQNHKKFVICLQCLNFQKACELEPLLNPSSISSKLTLLHGYIHPQKNNQAYSQAVV
jgi:hypothetical protein